MSTAANGYTEHEMSALTDDEREALAMLDADESEPEPEGSAEAAGTTDDAAGAEKAQDKPAASDTGRDTTSSDEQNVEAQQDDPKIVVQPAQTAFPQFAPPKDAEATIADIRSKVDAADEAFDLGEITAAEHRAQTRALLDQERAIRDELLKADMSHSARMQSYEVAVTSFLAANTEYEQGSQKYALLDAELRRLQNAAGASGGDPLDPRLIVEAHKSLQALFGGGAAPTPPKEQNIEPKGGTQKQTTTSSRRELPPSLATIPASDMQSVTEGQFAALSRLTGEAFETAFAKLTDAQRDQYLAEAN